MSDSREEMKREPRFQRAIIARRNECKCTPRSPDEFPAIGTEVSVIPGTGMIRKNIPCLGKCGHVWKSLPTVMVSFPDLQMHEVAAAILDIDEGVEP